jgi:hypothetical protein
MYLLDNKILQKVSILDYSDQIWVKLEEFLLIYSLLTYHPDNKTRYSIDLIISERNLASFIDKFEEE